MSHKNDKSAIVIVVFATIFIMFAFLKQFEEKPVHQIVYIKYISQTGYWSTYTLESKINHKVYEVQVSKNDYDNVKEGDSYSGKWKIKQ